MPWVFSLALLNAGKSIAARMVMMAITTSSSISVNPRLFAGRGKRFTRSPFNEGFLMFIIYPSRFNRSGGRSTHMHLYTKPRTIGCREIKRQDSRKRPSGYLSDKLASPVIEMQAYSPQFTRGERISKFAKGISKEKRRICRHLISTQL